MKSLTEYLAFNTKTRVAFVNITPQIRQLVKKSGIKEGMCLANAMHITASVFVKYYRTSPVASSCFLDRAFDLRRREFP